MNNEKLIDAEIQEKKAHVELMKAQTRKLNAEAKELEKKIK